MGNLVGSRLREMAELGQIRKQQIVQISSLLTVLVLVLYTVLDAANESWWYLGFNIVCSLLVGSSLLYSRKHSFSLAGYVLTAVLLAQAVMLFSIGELHPNRLFWLYPIIATIIFINRFPVGLLLSGGFCLLSTLAIYSRHPGLGGEAMAADRLIISLLVLSISCNICAYLYTQAAEYIQSLYQEGLEDMAYTDRLTGLANRWSFENWAKGKLEQQIDQKSLTALVFIDIDNFKTINDSYGHQIGDQVLKHFAQRLKNNVRHRDRGTEQDDYSIARFAGDEFVILLYGVKNKIDLDHILERISHLFHDKLQEENRTLFKQLTVSAGAALFPHDADTLEELTRCADKAMYAAKHHGKNQYCYYHTLSETHPLEDAITHNTVTPLRAVRQTYTSTTSQ